MDFSRLNYINDDFLKTVIRKALKIDKSEVVIDNKTIEAGAVIGDNYLSHIYRVQIEYSLSSGKGIEIVILKVIPKKLVPICDLLKANETEELMYVEVLPEMNKLAGTIFSPNLIHLQNEPEIVYVFSDLKESGFRNRVRREGLDLLHSQLCMSKLAQFHATSYFLTQKDVAIKKQNRCGLVHDNIVQVIKSHIDLLKDVAQSWGGYDEIILKLDNSKKNMDQIFYTAMETPESCPILVVNHGDFKTTNLLFKYQDEKPIDVAFVDFQISYYADPGFDLMYFLFSSVALDVMDNNYDELLDLYVDKFNSQMEQLSGKSVLTKETFLDIVKKRLYFGFLMSIFVCPFVLQLDENVIEVNMGQSPRNVFSNTAIQTYMKRHLKWFDQQGVLDLK